MRTLASVLVLVLAVSVLAVPVTANGPAQVSNPVTLEVVLVDTSGSPVGGAELTANWDGGEATASTVSNGRAFLDVPEGANVSIEVSHDDYVRNRPYEITDATAREIEITVAERGEATVQVNTPQGPADGATVWLWHDGNYVVTDRTDDAGQFVSPVIEQGEYRITVFQQGYAKNRTTLEVTDSVSTELTIRQASVTATFAVDDDHFDPPRPIEGASVQVGDVASVSTLGNGEATATVPVNTRLDVTVTKDGYGETTQELAVGERDVSLNATIQRTPGLNIALANGRVVVGESVRVEVTDEYGDPVSGVDLRVDGESVAETDDQGVAQVPIESQGSHEILARADSLEANTTVEGVAEGDDTEVAETTVVTTASGGGGAGFTLVAALLGVALALGAVGRR